MRLSICKDPSADSGGRYRILCDGDTVGALAWDGRGAFSLAAFERTWTLRQPDALERARQLGQGSRMLVAEGALAGGVGTRHEKDGLVGGCVAYVLSDGGGEVRGAPGFGAAGDAETCGYPNPGGGRGWRMSVYRAGGQIALVKRASEPVHTPDGATVVALDEDAAARALLLACYDVYVSYLENDGGAKSPFSFRPVNIFDTRGRALDDPRFEERCEGGQDGAALGEGMKSEAASGNFHAHETASGTSPAPKTAPESTTERAARLARGFAVKGGTDRRTH